MPTINAAYIFKRTNIDVLSLFVYARANERSKIQFMLFAGQEVDREAAYSAYTSEYTRPSIDQKRW